MNIDPSTYYYDCLTEWNALEADLKDPAGTCWIALGGLEVKLSDMEAGIQFTWPIYKEGAPGTGRGCMWCMCEFVLLLRPEYEPETCIRQGHMG